MPWRGPDSPSHLVPWIQIAAENPKLQFAILGQRQPTSALGPLVPWGPHPTDQSERANSLLDGRGRVNPELFFLCSSPRGDRFRNAFGATPASAAAHTPAASGQQIVDIFKPGAKVPRHKQETGSQASAPFSGAFTYYKALPPPRLSSVGFSASFSKAQGWGLGYSS